MNVFVRVVLLATGLAYGFAPIAVQAAPFPSPTDWRNENIYQIITDRYNDGDPSNNNAEAARGAPYAPGNSQGINGGDFRGIQQKLDYIKSLGATAIWISPIPLNVTNSAYHGYGAQDFYTLAPHWGTMTDLTNMIAAAHARGIKVILDIVCNHTGDLITGGSGYPTFKAPPSGYTMHYYNTHIQHAFPFNPTNVIPPGLSSLFHTNGEIQSFSSTQQVVLGELDGLDDLRTETTYVRTNLMNIYSNWVGIADFDGFRIDTVLEVDMGFWQYWCPQLHQFGTSIGKSNFFMFGEVDNGSDPTVGSYTGTEGGGAFKLDSTLDYPLYFLINPVFANATGNTKQIEDHYNAIAADYDPVAQTRLVTFLDNHDQPRFLSSNNANNNTNRLAVGLVFLYTARGIPCLYYGTEQAFNGSTDPNNREDMFAGQFEQGPSLGDNFNETHPLYRYVAMLNNFRRLYPALRTGVHNNLWNNPSGPGLFAYSRVLSNQEVFVAFNTASSSQTLPARPTTYPAGTVLVNLLNTNQTIVVNSTPNIPSITVPSTAAMVFIAQSQLKPLDPVVISQSPSHAATNVSTATAVVLRFNKPMDTNSVQAAFAMTPPKTGTFTWSAVHDTLTFTPSALGWPGLTTNLVHLATNAVDSVSGNSLFAPFDTYFVTTTNATVDVTPPVASIASPTSGATISSSLTISGTASDNVAVAKVEIQLDAGNWTTVTGTTSWSFILNTTSFLNGQHVISARATDTFGNVSPVVSVTVRFFNVPPDYLQRISGGDPSNVTDCASNVWVADQAYSLGSFGYSGGTNGYLNNAITGICSSAWPLYQRERFSTSASSFTYLFDCPAGIYETTLLEAETYWTNSNQRVFNVFIEGQEVLTNFDIFATAGGANIPLTLVFTNTVSDAQLEIDFFPIVDNARISGIQVRKIADLDSDGDGIPDWWMLAYFNHPTGQDADNSMANEDADGDGLSNLQEFLAGTDPTDPNSVFRITDISAVGPDISITWTTQPNKTNQLERSAAVDSNAFWFSVDPITIGTGSPANQTDPGAATNPPAFYRVRLVP